LFPISFVVLSAFGTIQAELKINKFHLYACTTHGISAYHLIPCSLGQAPKAYFKETIKQIEREKEREHRENMVKDTEKEAEIFD